MKVLKDILKANEDRKIIIMPVGISGSGKTTLFKDLKEDFDIEYISFDKIRVDIYRKNFPEKEDIKYSEVFRYITDNKIKILPLAKKQLLDSDRRLFYIDNTNLTKKARRKFLLLCDDCLKIAVYFKPDLKECIKRQFNKDRDKRLKPSVILNQYSAVEKPDFSEFDIIITKKINGKIDEKGRSDNRCF
ncbi:MAG TPA: hypothetical protein DEP48_05675 [Persephonella sp.]|uniref:Uncharacterized protein n=1 Tax=Persephonella marina (strain DSM 14350 / EX-H1) TaxID=123214 RepID=C0QPF8_PERMH|nr:MULTISPECIES: AAA family ATPase [Persephonella]ACO04433.1 hypothetical protein PERMA_0767 [Persephonella marina EX-H1]HCB69831.1 hypothetical protein [Persephonella sp.]